MATENRISNGEWYIGERKDFEFLITRNGDVQDLTGWSLSYMVKRRKTDPNSSALITKTTDGGGILLTSPALGMCTVEFEEEDSQGMRAGVLYYGELKRTDEGLEAVLSEDDITLDQSVHR